jgi:hypothetical protein
LIYLVKQDINIYPIKWREIQYTNFLCEGNASAYEAIRLFEISGQLAEIAEQLQAQMRIVFD